MDLKNFTNTPFICRVSERLYDYQYWTLTILSKINFPVEIYGFICLLVHCWMCCLFRHCNRRWLSTSRNAKLFHPRKRKNPMNTPRQTRDTQQTLHKVFKIMNALSILFASFSSNLSNQIVKSWIKMLIHSFPTLVIAIKTCTGREIRAISRNWYIHANKSIFTDIKQTY